MKSKDLLMIGAVVLGAYMLIPKAKEAVGGVAPTFIGMPSAQAPSDIGGIFSGMASMFSGLLGAMPAGGDTSNLYTLPSGDGESDGGIFNIDDWEKRMTDFWNTLNLPGPPDKETTTPTGDNGDGVLSKLLDIITGKGAEFGGGEVIVTAPDLELTPPDVTIGGKTVTGAMGGFIGDILLAPSQIFMNAINTMTGKETFYTKEVAKGYQAESEAVFEKAGVTEIQSMADIKALQAARASLTGRGSEDKQTDISLITKITSLTPGQISRQYWA